MAFNKKNKQFFKTKNGISISLIFNLLGLSIFVPSTIKEFSRNSLSPNSWLCLLFLCFFIFGFISKINRIIKLRIKN